MLRTYLSPRSLVLTPLLLLALAGCGGGGSGTSNTPPNPNPGAAHVVPSVKYFAVVVLENTDYSSVVNNSSMPYLNSLISQGALATEYFADTHPSIGNYFDMTTGMQITNDDNFSGVVSTDNVVRELTAAGITWKTYQESIPSSGYLGGDAYPYLRHHDPFSYFSDVQQSPTLAQNIVPFSQFASDLSGGALPRYMFITPNAEHDAHDCPDGSSVCLPDTKLATADQWLSTNIAPLLANQDFINNGILVITFDEASDLDFTHGGGKVFTLVLGSHVRPGYQATGTYDHRSLLDLSMTSLGVATVPNTDGTVQRMNEFFQ